MNKEEFINEFNDWTKEEILGRAFEICCYHIELKEIEKEHQKINGDLRVENKELQDRIDKAIEYIKKHRQIYDIDGSVEPKIDDFSILASPKHLIDLLKGGKQ